MSVSSLFLWLCVLHKFLQVSAHVNVVTNKILPLLSEGLIRRLGPEQTQSNITNLAQHHILLRSTKKVVLNNKSLEDTQNYFVLYRATRKCTLQALKNCFIIIYSYLATKIENSNKRLRRHATLYNDLTEKKQRVLFSSTRVF